jgi:hypothetical protein
MQRGGMKPQRRAIPDIPRQAAFHGSQAGCARENDDGVLHP